MVARANNRFAWRTSRWARLACGLAIAFVFLLLVAAGLWKYRNREWSEADAELQRQLNRGGFSVAGGDVVRAADWPQWRGPRRDGVSPETGLLTEWPEGGPRRRWDVALGSGYSSPAVADGRVFTMLREGEDEAVVCLDADGGKEIWRRSYPCNDSARRFASGPRSTPAVDGDLVFAVGATGIFHCLRTEDGAVLWRHDLLTEYEAAQPTYGVSFSPLVQGELVYAQPGGRRGSLVAFHKRSGEPAWKSLEDPASYSSPVTVRAGGEDQIVFLTAKALVGVSPREGKELWRFPWETPDACNVATPIAVGDYLFISSGYHIGCALVKVEKRGDGAFEARRVYKNNRMCNHFTSSVYYRDHFYGFNNTTLTCMEARAGEVRWRRAGFGKGSLLVADGQLIILGERGRLALAVATPEEYHQRAVYQVSDEECWTAPVLARGKLYVRDPKRLLCLEVAGK